LRNLINFNIYVILNIAVGVGLKNENARDFFHSNLHKSLGRDFKSFKELINNNFVRWVTCLKYYYNIKYSSRHEAWRIKRQRFSS